MFQTDLLKGRRILVTGGGTGLGLAMASRFAELGATLWLCGRRVDVIEAAASRIRDAGGDASGFVCDIRDASAVDTLMDELWRLGPLDVLVNNAAASFIAQTESLSSRAADAILATTLHGAMYMTLAAGKRWIADAHGGVVLSILSTSTLTGRAFTVPSAMAKAGLLAMTRSLAVEWGPKRIRTVAIAPGPFPTPGADSQLNPAARQRGRDAAASTNPLGRVGEHHELANLAAYLVSDAAGYINGEMIAIDGGQHLRTSGAEDLLSWTSHDWKALRDSRQSTPANRHNAAP